MVRRFDTDPEVTPFLRAMDTLRREASGEHREHVSTIIAVPQFCRWKCCCTTSLMAFVKTAWSFFVPIEAAVIMYSWVSMMCGATECRK
jgi:hypothetical protein